MSQRKTLMTIEYNTDSETGIYNVGEIDFGIFSGILDDYLKQYGHEGKNEIIRTLAYLIYEVERRSRETNFNQTDNGSVSASL